MRTTLAVVLVAAAGAAAQPVYQADFDALTEGNPTTVLVTGGLTFTDLDQRLPGSPPPHPFVIENASGTLASAPNFSSPNTLGFSGYSPGPGAAFSRFGSMRIIPESKVNQVFVDVYEFFTGVGNSIVLAGYLNGQEVQRTAIPIIGGAGVHHYQLFVAALTSEGFDEVRLLGEGPNDQGVFFGLVDNVTLIYNPPDCYANCDGSTMEPLLNVADFGCFLSKFALGDPYANCDGSTASPQLNVADFGCFLTKFALGCE